MTQPGERVTLPGNRTAYVVAEGSGYFLRDEHGQPVECDINAWWADIESHPMSWQAAARERDLHGKVYHTLQQARYTPEQLYRMADTAYPDRYRTGD